MATTYSCERTKPTAMEQSLPVLELGLALVAAAIWYTGGGAIWYRQGGVPWLPYVLVLCIWPLRLLVTHGRLRNSPVTWACALLLASAAVGVWAAYAIGPAFSKFGLMVGAVSLCAAMAHQRRWWQVYLGLSSLGGLGIVVALYFVASYDWSDAPVKMAAMNQVGGQIARMLPSISGHRISPNVAGGLLASLAPSYVPLVWLAWDGWRGLGQHPRLARALAMGWGMGAAVVLVVLLVTSSRGAWLAVLLAAMLWLWWRLLGVMTHKRTAERHKAWRMRLIWMGISIGVGIVALVAAAMLVLQYDLPGAGTLGNRLGLYRDASLLARDYWMTGAGLGVFEMQFSIYTLLIHVGYIVNAHDVLLDLLIEQGLLGLVGYLGVVIGAIAFGVRRLGRSSPHTRWILEGALLSILVAATHGVFDDVHYGSRALLFMFAPVGLILSAGKLSAHKSRSNSSQAGDRRVLVAFAVAAFVIIGAGWRPLVAQWWATLGAVEQSRIELNVYDQFHFHDLTMDEVRQQQDLARPKMLYQRALAAAPISGNRLAQQRLSGIAMAQNDYDAALELTRALWLAGRRDSVTRMLYGDALVAHGRTDEAADVLQDLPWAVARLNGQAWDRYYERGDMDRAIAAWSTVLALDPTSEFAAYWLGRAQGD